MVTDKSKKSFFEELQALDEPTKRKVVVISTSVIMAIVIYVWLGYFNGLVSGLSQSDQSQTQSVGFWQTVQSAPAFIAGSSENFFHSFRNMIQSPSQYTVEPQK